ncbi:MAG: 1,4-alpha-glucan branching protein GlgB [Acholeplasmatales bacterium]|nr:1,4-alpha-glucan branching protein GlgB [Acholeplasmatales bacterium]
MIRDSIDSNFLYLFDNGDNNQAYKVFGSHLVKDKKGKNISCEFCLYAPNAVSVELIGEWNYFTEGEIKLEKIDNKGIWYINLAGDYENKRYKYVLLTHYGQKLYKCDPYAYHSALRPLQDSVVYDIDKHKWTDDVWMYTHPKTYDKPMCIYEMHLGSWKRTGPGENDFYNYKEIAKMLVEYLADFGYTHVEVMPVYEHPLDASWGYQVISYYAITPRYGTPDDFMEFVNILHNAGYGVILDWVPGHICKDAQGLYMFDGTPLYDYEREEDRENKEWGTANLDLGKGTTRSFLISNALYYMNYYHIDGFRVDAVSNLIYYLGNENRGVNNGATEFIKRLSYNIFNKDDRVLLIAEDSSSYPNVTKSTEMGLGFNYKWDMGWMNDTLKYFKKDPIYRKYHHNQLTFSMMYFYNEQFLLPLSHDEVVHMKGSLLNKMPGDQWQQFANYRLLIGYMMTHPGKKLLFMGDELATYDEWHFERDIAWDILDYPMHDAAQRFVKELTKLYKNERSLWELDYSYNGFKFIEANNSDQSIFVYARFSSLSHDHLIIVMNATPNTYDNYRIGCIEDEDYEYVEIMNSDKDIYNGSNRINPNPIKVTDREFQNEKHSICITVAPLAIQIFKPVKIVKD